ncbi:MAG: hypothetical protein A2312_00115 [Candidatus Staskawiczbacteria bacterium RIFOXYB2_FULL_32_9]|uniref:Uncharacterized protein n=1 Tax=Candidatus Staskawiczbacteria bacterium RIFOXYD1_FULL_32_13 TaxID=1802234 RepID=A0A1G2JNX4_9BACT|nr:MAG: hypothetical protein A2360_04110 [Candidatus Staskawiczbacteria bacterium RIFOXYB1_FULL_32_11]OGZ84833.1 MAG: hypothetical protein A2312_00115 [Candidatus Staskawiczbacteria bacterium RIFOXYB2_FULL_32_9]OGZ85841.1 MAG: hypothetical protein A2463_03080 [Candidatus Staskawiczbacteria bacterium RIFOXYC2_FULL_32_10]OGZ87990.1 MAG: hypothetical protein A2561_02770 [Candidatus Staskawiczbacteria bacterium RIFOXYD1_FULL_32_13]
MWEQFFEPLLALVGLTIVWLAIGLTSSIIMSLDKKAWRVLQPYNWDVLVMTGLGPFVWIPYLVTKVFLVLFPDEKTTSA